MVGISLPWDSGMAGHWLAVYLGGARDETAVTGHNDCP